jgi:hypothetical protein
MLSSCYVTPVRRCHRVLRAGRPRRTGRKGAPWYAALVAVALLLLQGPSLLHLLLVQHATCEHGDLIEVTSSAAEAAPAAAPTRASAPSDQARIERSHGDNAGHDHCDALAVRHRVPDVGVSIAPSTLLPGTLIEAGGERGEARPVPLLSLAPKSSPPA